MKNITRATALAAVPALVAMAVAGCSSDASDDDATDSDDETSDDDSDDVSDDASDATDETSDDVTDTDTDTTESSVYTPDEDDPYATGSHHATIEIEGYGTIELTLNADVAPITVSNFCNLALSGFYDGLTIHRVVEDFVIQGGDPEGDGTGGSDQTITGEFAANGIENSIAHVRGTISMARSTSYDSATSQFFIVVATSTSNSSALDGYYAAFGTATSGMDVVDDIVASVEVEDSNGTVAAENQPVITSVTIVD